jgi:voltage-gated potassium channel
MQDRPQPYLVFMLLLSLIALVALAVEVAFPLDQGTRTILAYGDLLVCGLFFLDFLIVLRRAEDKWKYLATWGWLDLVSSVPAVSALRFARAARVVRILRVLRGVRAARILTRFVLERRAQSAVLAAALVTIILVVVSAISVLHFEVPANGNIRTPEDAAWWAITTITTVGYGDKVPITSEGRLVAAILMVAGFGLFATVSGSLAAWFLAPSGARREDQIESLRAEIAEIKSLLKKQHTGSGQ